MFLSVCVRVCSLGVLLDSELSSVLNNKSQFLRMSLSFTPRDMKVEFIAGQFLSPFAEVHVA